MVIAHKQRKWFIYYREGVKITWGGGGQNIATIYWLRGQYMGGGGGSKYRLTPATFSWPCSLAIPIASPHEHAARVVMYAGIHTSGWSRWRGKSSRHSRLILNQQFSVSGKGPGNHHNNKKTHISIHVYCTGHIVGVNVVNRSNDIRNAPVLLYCDAGLYSFMLCSIECGFVLCCASFSWCDFFCSHEIHSFNPSIILIVGSLALTISHKWTESDEDW